MHLPKFKHNHVLAICAAINDRRLDNKIFEACMAWNEVACDGEDVLGDDYYYTIPNFEIIPWDYGFGNIKNWVRMLIVHPQNSVGNTSTCFFLMRENENDSFVHLFEKLYTSK